MKKVLVDTDVFSYLIDDRPEAHQFRAALRGRELVLSFISVGELLYGARHANWGSERVQRLRQAIGMIEIVDPNDMTPDYFAAIVDFAVKRGLPLGQRAQRADAWIAALALSHGLALATNNHRHYAGINDLEVIGPTSA